MVWGLRIIFVFSFWSLFRGGILITWKGLIWAGLNVGENISFLRGTFILVVRVIVLHAMLLRRFYMSGEANLRGFLFTTMLLVRSMLLLITRDSLLTLFLGWDGLGVSSLLLVIWYQSWNRIDRGIITLLSNRLGDFFLILRFIGYLSLGWAERSLSWNLGFSFLLVLACFTKRAQIPLRVWLPMAIRAPTPIRALVHSRTLVTAGLFLAIKLRRFLLCKIFWLLGGLTMLVAGAIRFLEIDLKKVVALSTLRQLGFMGAGLGIGLFSLTFFHIIRHAFIKRAFLILVGLLLHRNFRAQDKRLIRVFSDNERFCLRGLILCSLALCGIRLTRGLVRKEAFLFQRRALRRERFLFLRLFLVVSFTLIYCGRLLRARVQSILLRQGTLGGRTKTVRRRGGLLFLRVCRAWRLIDSFIYISPPGKSWERITPLVLIGIAFLVWQITKPWGLVLRRLGFRLALRQLAKTVLNLRKKDRETVDQRNWIMFRWIEWSLGRSRKRYKGLYIIFYLIILRLFFL